MKSTRIREKEEETATVVDMMQQETIIERKNITEGITETKQKGKCIMRIHTGQQLMQSGVEEYLKLKEAVVLTVAPNRLTGIISEEYVNERLFTVGIEL